MIFMTVETCSVFLWNCKAYLTLVLQLFRWSANNVDVRWWQAE